MVELYSHDARYNKTPNRVLIDSGALEAVERVGTYKNSAGADVLMDVDHFKLINDRRGHSGGDAVLGAVARLLTRCVRSCDVVARWGGEEFVVGLPSTPLEGAAEVAERLRAQLEAEPILDPSGELVPVTASFGVADLVTQEKLDQLIDRADRAMYSAKSAGRNQVFTARGNSLIPGPVLREQAERRSEPRSEAVSAERVA